ncbi:MAG: MBL fold metallo-hydrolase [Dehalococcoidia bacterium]|nr:MBL fold metallo-hydrolase [Dehalococcoidia bacterium]
MQIQWLGHAAFKLTTNEHTAYIDPCLIDSIASKQRRLFADAPKADFILFTHEHPDHCDPASCEGLLKKDTVLVGPASCAARLGAALRIVEPETEFTLGEFTIRAVHAYNISRHRSPGKPFHPRGTGVGYLVTVDGRSLYHAGDTEPIPEMKNIGPVDVALLPTDDHYTMSPEEVMQVAGTVSAKLTIPMHFFNTTPADVASAAQRHTDVRLRILEIGDTYDLP